MCGISGIVAREKLTPELRAAAERMSAAQVHRGPDGAGALAGENFALASRRLSIIDPRGGWQPLYNEDQSLALFVNGEIYNYVELRERLKTRGHSFRTDADGEVIVHLYEEDSKNFINHLRGMFAFALWDARRERLVLARDRMGEKPLYLFERDGLILFASEMKSLLASRLIPLELDARAVNLYFHYQYVPEPLAAIKGVRKLDAARTLVLDIGDWRAEEKTYWRIEESPALEGEPKSLIRARLEEVSELIVRSDLPVGVALSGGLDSSVVAAFAARSQPDLCAFAVGYAGRPESDERADAERFARHLKIPFCDVELDARTIVDFFPQLNFWRDDPVADIAGFGYYAVARLARNRGVPVLLQGQGGDELFWGYPQLRAAFSESEKKAALLKNPFSQTILQSLKFNLPKNRSPRNMPAWWRDFGGARSAWRGVRERLKNPEQLVFYDAAPDFVSAAREMASYYSPTFGEKLEARDACAPFTIAANEWASSLETTLTALICATYLRENGIAQGDRLAMASSVEMRLPLIDYRFVETVVGLRKNQTDARLPPKHWLKAAVADVLPEWVLNRPKRGFAPPVRQWHDALFAAYGDSLRDGFLVEAEILSRAGAARLAAGDFPFDATSPLSFKALVLEQWCRQMSGVC